MIQRDRYVGGTDPIGDSESIHNTNEWRQQQHFMEDQSRRMMFGEEQTQFKPYEPEERIRVRQEIVPNTADPNRPLSMEHLVHIKSPGSYRVRAMFTPMRNKWNMTGEDTAAFDIDIEAIDISYPEDIKNQLRESEKRVEELEALLAIKEMVL